jgi:hypothetical protein
MGPTRLSRRELIEKGIALGVASLESGAIVVWAVREPHAPDGQGPHTVKDGARP